MSLLITHFERDDDPGGWESEVVSHIVQFIYDPLGNSALRKQLLRTLNRMQQRRDQPNTLSTDLDTYDKRRYDKARYVALLFTAANLAKTNLGIRQILENDIDPNKLNALRELPNIINGTDIKLLQSDSIKELIKISRAEIEPYYNTLCENYGIVKNSSI